MGRYMPSVGRDWGGAKSRSHLSSMTRRFALSARASLAILGLLVDGNHASWDRSTLTLIVGEHRYQENSTPIPVVPVT